MNIAHCNSKISTNQTIKKKDTFFYKIHFLINAKIYF